MFGHLFIKECKQTAKSMIYWLIILILLIFFNSQLGSMEFAEKPEPGQEDYGMVAGGDEQATMEATLGYLVSEYRSGSFTTYPIGFYKTVKPSQKELKRIHEIVTETTGLSTDQEIDDAMTAAQGDSQIVYGSSPVKPKDGLTFERFCALMEETDDMLGGGSNYSKESLKTNAKTPMTYEQALQQYNDLTEKDHFTGAYARLFSDYMGIMLGILPVFLAATRGMRDRRSRMQALIASRKASSAVIIFSRYFSMIVMLMLPVLLISCIPLSECIKAAGGGIRLDYLAFVKYSVGWLMPTAMISTAVGMVLTELTDTALGVLVQLIWWFLSVFSSMSAMHGGIYGWDLVPRHNTPFNYEGFHAGFSQLAANRALYAGISILLAAVTVWIYSLKRKGRLDIRGKLFGNRKREHKA
ncbi:ABC transporter permease [Clostridium sp. AF19-22AC]|mgnify:CR=1 FL=1|jgi:ABC-2 type transport system permease protein|uniref:Uncharacterized protein n=1 Tax=Faecalicatena orotica TaxID=1544 RepID=A0A2Y9BBQ4_9FIRM|nr:MULTISPECIES: ABC transporter permease [Clostridia]PWJ30775.1 hypothetical protein A8806_103179 [Faecalicatena orotica]RHR32586.1 ABC transporter permease [Clostridium sp. AF19-22AC]SSA54936.1 hypothetical protein SAMN05216536_103179 [Faecalicatena orotica]